MAEYIEREVGAELVEKLRYYANTYTIGDNLGREIEGTDELLFEASEVIEKLIAADVPRWCVVSGSCTRTEAEPANGATQNKRPFGTLIVGRITAVIAGRGWKGK